MVIDDGKFRMSVGIKIRFKNGRTGGENLLSVFKMPADILGGQIRFSGKKKSIPKKNKNPACRLEPTCNCHNFNDYPKL